MSWLTPKCQCEQCGFPGSAVWAVRHWACHPSHHPSCSGTGNLSLSPPDALGRKERVISLPEISHHFTLRQWIYIISTKRCITNLTTDFEFKHFRTEQNKWCLCSENGRSWSGAISTSLQLCLTDYKQAWHLYFSQVKNSDTKWVILIDRHNVCWKASKTVIAFTQPLLPRKQISTEVTHPLSIFIPFSECESKIGT